MSIEKIRFAREIGSKQIVVARAVVDAEEFSNERARLLLTNPAVLSDRLNFVQFSKLSGSVQGDLTKVAERSLKEIKAISLDGSIGKLPHESSEQHEYRVEISSVLHGLQRAVAIGPDSDYGYRRGQEDVISELIMHASHGFWAVLYKSWNKDTRKLGVI